MSIAVQQNVAKLIANYYSQLQSQTASQPKLPIYYKSNSSQGNPAAINHHQIGIALGLPETHRVAFPNYLNQTPQANTQPTQVPAPTQTTPTTVPTAEVAAPAPLPMPTDIIGYGHIGYGSLPAGAITTMPDDSGKNYKLAKLIIPLEANKIAGDLFKANMATMYSKEWQAVVAAAAHANGGLGSTEEGFLAWSKEGHFVRLLNPDMDVEHNRRMALMSLQAGFAVEDLPSRLSFADFSDPQHFFEKNENFLAKHDTSLAAFLEDPTKRYQVKDGRGRFEMRMNPETGEVGSVHYKLARGFKGWLQKNYKWISKVTSAVGWALNIIPGVGTAASAIVKGLKFAMDSVVAGKVKAQQAVGVAADIIKGIFF